MIRRDYDDPTLGPCYALITQHDHALLAGQLALHLGTSRFQRPEPFAPFHAAVSLHDAGWPAHDDHPTLNPKGKPLHVFESPLAVTLQVWPGAPVLAARNPNNGNGWAELLASVHILTLSGIAAAHHQPKSNAAFDPSEMAARFEINKFQHREIERQQHLRAALCFPTHVPLSLGLADDHASPQDDLLLHHYRWLQALDLLSLALCCTTVPQTPTPGVYHSPGSSADPLNLSRDGNDLIVRPYPFKSESIPLSIPARLIPRRAYSSPADLQEALTTAPQLSIPATVRPF